MSDKPTMLQDRMQSMVHAFSDEGRKHAVRLLAADVGKLERELASVTKGLLELEEEKDELDREFQDLERKWKDAETRIKQLQHALSLVVPKCDCLHHPKKYQHMVTEPCPVEELIRKAKNP